MRRTFIAATAVFLTPMPGSVRAQETIEPNIESCAVENKTLTQSLECNVARAEQRAERRQQQAENTREELESAYRGPNTFRCTNQGKVVVEALADYVNFDRQSGRYSINYNGGVTYYTAGGGDLCELIAP